MPQNHRQKLQDIARNVMMEHGLEVDFSPAARAELEGIHTPAVVAEARDLRDLLWCSIDNDDSRDLDQLSVAEALPDGTTKVLVAVADVDALVHKNSAIDKHAQKNTTSIYTAAIIFPMLPEKLSTNLTSLNFDEDRVAMIFEMIVDAEGAVTASDIYRATVRNKAKLAYASVAAWLDNTGPMPDPMAAVAGLPENIRLQFAVAEKLREVRHKRGSLDFETIETHPVFEGDELVDLVLEKRNSSKDIIEDFMVAANGVSARFLASKNLPSLRRVVKVPKHWDLIVELAGTYNYRLPEKPDSKALDTFLIQQRDEDPLRFPDLSLNVIKLLGAGEYSVELPGGKTEGHFGLAVKDYSHSTAPNRRYPDILTQRLLKAALAGEKPPYTLEELEELALRCTTCEDAAKKVERQVRKSVEAILLQRRVGEHFKALVTGVNEHGTWVRLLDVPVEGKLMESTQQLTPGQELHVELIDTNVERGFIDFKPVG